MKILHLASTDKGGAGGATVRTHQHLLNAGVNSKLLCLYQSRPHVEQSFSFFKTKRENDHLALKLFDRLQRKQFQIAKSIRLKKARKAGDFFHMPFSPYFPENHPLVKEADIINLHWVAEFINFPTFFKEIEKPVVWRLPDLFPLTGGYHYEKYFPMSNYQNLSNHFIEIKRKAVQGKNVHFIPLCHWMSDKLEKSIYSSMPKTIIPNGINTKTFQPWNKDYCKELFQLPKDKNILLFVAASLQDDRKGMKILLGALDKELGNPNGKRLHLALIGSGKPAINLPSPHFTRIGSITDELLLAQAYSASDLFIIPSVEDNLPNTVIESLACGTPVVGFNIGGIPDMVKPPMNGVLVDELSETALAKGIQQALSMDFDRARIREDAVQRFDQSVQASRYIELYKSLIS